MTNQRLQWTVPGVHWLYIKPKQVDNGREKEKENKKLLAKLLHTILCTWTDLDVHVNNGGNTHQTSNQSDLP